MKAAIAAFPDHLSVGWNRGEILNSFGLRIEDHDAVVVCGMGGSAIGGDLMRGLVAPTSPVPVLVVRGYRLPEWVGERTLVVASSYSGSTEETLSCAAEARRRGAKVLAITSGGELAERDVPAVVIPGGLQPRAALGYSLGVGLRLAQTLGLARLTDDLFGSVVDAARTRDARFNSDEDRTAGDLAEAFDDALPVVYTGAGLLEAVGVRWRTQLNENAKHPAIGNALPELDHNEIMGYEAGPASVIGRFAVVALRDADDHPQVARRFDATRDLVRERVGSWTDVSAEGQHALDRMVSMIQLGDWVSYALALRKGVDPTPVQTIQSLKQTLADG